MTFFLSFCALFFCLNLMIACLKHSLIVFSKDRPAVPAVGMATPTSQPRTSVSNLTLFPTLPASNTFTFHWLTRKQLLPTNDGQKCFNCALQCGSHISCVLSVTQRKWRLVCETEEKKIQSSLYFSEVYSATTLWAKDFNSPVTFKAALAVVPLFTLNNSPI